MEAELRAVARRHAAGRASRRLSAGFSSSQRSPRAPGTCPAEAGPAPLHGCSRKVLTAPPAADMRSVLLPAQLWAPLPSGLAAVLRLPGGFVLLLVGPTLCRATNGPSTAFSVTDHTFVRQWKRTASHSALPWQQAS